MTAPVLNPNLSVDIVQVAQALADEFRPGAAELDRTASFPEANYERLSQTGYLRAPVPRELGGLGCGLWEISRAQQQLARGCASTALAVNMHLFQVGAAADAWRSTRAAGVEALLRRVADEGIVLGSSAAEMIVAGEWSSTTVARRADGGYLVSGHKHFVSQAPVMDLVRVAATDADSGETLLMMIPACSSGVAVVENWDTTGMRATASHDVVLEDVFVADADVVQRFSAGPPMRQPALAVAGIWFQPLIASVYLGVAEEARALALRGIGADTNSGYRHSVLTDVLVGELEGEFLTAEAIRDQVVSQLDADRADVQRAFGRAILCRQLVVSHAVATVNKAVELAGGRAYFRKSPLERLARDACAARFHPPAAPVSFQMVGERVRESLV